jgi:hypothetical protein
MSDFAERPEERPGAADSHREGALLAEEETCFRELFSQEAQSAIREALSWLKEADPDSHESLMCFVVRLSLCTAKAKYVHDPVEEFCRSKALPPYLAPQEVKYRLKAALLLLGDRIKKGAR